MRRWNRLPLRVRLTLVFAAGTAIVLFAFSVFVYVHTGAVLLEATEAGLASRAEILSTDVELRGPALADVGATLIERDEAFAQIANASGRIVQSSSVVQGHPLLPATVVEGLMHPQLFDRRIPGIDDVTRVLAVPVDASGGSAFVLVGSSLQDRRDQMLQLAATLGIAGPIALAVIAGAGWLLAGAALRPVERMRSEAAALSARDLETRLSLPPTDDEIARLGRTFNDLLDRIAESFERELRFVDDASHELRTPLSILKAEVDLALSRGRSPAELEAALRSAADETDHLVRLAEDLLVLSRARGGELPIHRVTTSLPAFLDGVASHCVPRASGSGVSIEVHAADGEVSLDPVRLRQALDGLLDNSLRYTPAGGSIRLSAERIDGEVHLSVDDDGSGFSSDVLADVFEPFRRGRTEHSRNTGAGLGLSIVRAIAEAHGGSVRAQNKPDGGALVTIVVRDPA